jgi:signal transduction histidine kinase
MVNRTAIDNLIKDLLQELDGLLKAGQQIVYTNSVVTMICIDKNLVKNILINLISNAIKFSPENSNIWITSLVEDDKFILSVKDNGMGISEEDQGHLFRTFFSEQKMPAIYKAQV